MTLLLLVLIAIVLYKIFVGKLGLTSLVVGVISKIIYTAGVLIVIAAIIKMII